MSNRITVEYLEARITTANQYARTDGAAGHMFLYSAYGKVAVRQVSGDGARTISDLMTKRELANFLDGMIAAYRTVETVLTDW